MLLFAACTSPRATTSSERSEPSDLANLVAGPAPVVALADGPTDEAPAVSTNPNPQSVRGFVGWTTERSDGGVTIAGQYEYRLRREWGAGAYADLVFGDDTAFLAGVGLFWHPVPQLNLMAGPGIDFENDDFFARAGASYDFEWKDFGVGPAAFVDLGASGTPILIALQISYDW
jgi:hypothetical protein